MNGWYPTLNNKGEVVSGSGEVCFGSVADWQAGRIKSFGVGWFPNFIDDDTIVFNGDTRGVVIANVRTGQTHQGSATAYNKIAAGGGKWAGLWQGNPITTTLFQDTTVLENYVTPNSGGIAMSRSGNFLRWNRFFDQSHDLFVNGTKVLTGSIVTGSISDTAWVCRVGEPGQAIGAKIGESVTHNWSVVNWEDPVVCDGPDGPWICSVTQTGLIFRPAGETKGYSWTGEYFNPCVRFIGSAFTIVASDSHGSPKLMQVDPASPRVLLGAGATQPPVDQPPTTSNEVISMQAFDRKMWIAPFFSHSERYGMTSTADHAGNAIIITEDMTDAGMKQVFNLGFPMIIASKQMTADRANTTIAYWTGNAAEAQEALANPVEKPVIWYEDVGTVNAWPATRPAWVNEKVWPTVQCYRTPGEALTSFESRMRAMLDRVQTYGRPTFLVPRFDDFNGTGTIAQTLEAMPVYQKLLADYEIVGFMPFADRRGNGIAKNQDLHDWAMAFKMANPARPNRFDYWQPSGTDMTTLLKNKLGQSTLLITLTDAEKKFILDALQGTSQPPVQPPTPSLQWPNLQGMLETERAKYPDMVTADQCVAIINAVALSHPGLGLLKKPGGNHGLQPKSGIPCSVDWVIMKDGRGADVLSDGGNIDGTLGRGAPSWPSEPSTDVQDPNNWVAPTA